MNLQSKCSVAAFDMYMEENLCLQLTLIFLACVKREACFEFVQLLHDQHRSDFSQFPHTGTILEASIFTNECLLPMGTVYLPM